MFDLRYAARTLRRSPGFSIAAILTLALGIGANTAIFSVVNRELLRPLPFADPDRLVRVAERNDKLNLPVWTASVLNYLSWREQTQTLESIAAIGFGNFNLTGQGDPEQISGATISPSLLPLLGLRPIAGRSFREGEDRPGSPPVALISEGLWRRRFGGQPNLVGQTIALNGIAYTVVGIAPRGLAVLAPGDIWTPLIIDPPHEARLNHVINAVGRLRPGVTIEQSQSEMDAIATRVGREYPEVRDWGIRLVTFSRWFVPDQLRTALLVLMGAVGFVLLIASANVANLLLSRAAARRTEIAIRTAMGASRFRLARQLLAESMLLSTIGGGAGVLLAVWAVNLMNGSLPQGLLPLPEIEIDRTVLLFAAAVTLGTGALFGLAPAWQTSRTDLNSVLKQGGRSNAGGRTPRLRNALVAIELALATVLLTGAGLLIQTLMRLERVNVGFPSESLLTFQISPPPAKYPSASVWSFYRRLLEELNALPDRQGAAASSGIPFGAGAYNTTPVAAVSPSLLPPGTSVPIDWRSISPGYFHAMRIPVLRGRDFTDQDSATAPAVVVVSAETARRMWGSEDVVGRVLRVVGSGREFTIIGVVAGVRNTSLNQDLIPAMYFSAAARSAPVMDIVIRTAGKPEASISAVRAKLRELDAELPMTNVRTMDEWISSSAAQPRLNSVLLAGFAALALVIAAVGIYGVLSYSVSQRTREIGLRMAMGARESNVLRLIVGEGMLVAAIGIGVGLAGAIAMSRALASLLFGVTARDPLTLIGVACALTLVAALACYVPARRASRLDPVVALRDE